MFAHPTGHRLVPASLAGLALVVGFSLPACREKVSGAQCDALITRYAELVVRGKMPDAPAQVVLDAQKTVRAEAAGDESFRNCTTEIGPKEFNCAMAAKTPEAVEKCIE